MEFKSSLSSNTAIKRPKTVVVGTWDSERQEEVGLSVLQNKWFQNKTKHWNEKGGYKWAKSFDNSRLSQELLTWVEDKPENGRQLVIQVIKLAHTTPAPSILHHRMKRPLTRWLCVPTPPLHHTLPVRDGLGMRSKEFQDQEAHG